LCAARRQYRGTASPIKLDRTPATYRRAPPRFGADTDAIIDEFGLAGSPATAGVVRR